MHLTRVPRINHIPSPEPRDAKARPLSGVSAACHSTRITAEPSSLLSLKLIKLVSWHTTCARPTRLSLTFELTARPFCDCVLVFTQPFQHSVANAILHTPYTVHHTPHATVCKARQQNLQNSMTTNKP